MHDARGVANYFLDLAQQRGVDVTVMTLLKVLYFAHGWYLAKYGVPLVAQPFEAWQHGPVNRVVYDQLKGFGAKPVGQYLKSFDANICGYVDARAAFDGETAQFLSSIFDYYTRFHAFKLSDLTHEPGSPWDVVWQAAETRAVPGMIIPDSLIIEWFRGEGQRMKRSS
jgi:uncharacterized phage-associated protein